MSSKRFSKEFQGMEDELAQELLGHTGADPDDEADAVAAALKDVQAAERLVLAAEGLVGVAYQDSTVCCRKPRCRLGTGAGSFRLDDDGPVGFDLPDFAVEA